VTATHAANPSLPALFHPRARPRELALLIVAGIALVLGSLSLGLTRTGTIRLADESGLLTYLGALLLAHVLLTLSGRHLDEVLLPTAGILGGIGLLLMERLPQSLVAQRFGSLTLGLGKMQLIWLVIALAIATATALLVRSDRWLRLYRYTWAALGMALLGLTFVFGSDVNGSRLALDIGPITGQPSELIKIILVVFFAAYLAENRVLLADARRRVIGPITLPPLPYLLPAATMLLLALGMVVVSKDLGAALLFYVVFLGIYYAATGSRVDVFLGLVLFFVGFLVLYQVFGHVRARVDIWLNPWSDAQGTGYQIIQGLHAFARGGILGTGLGAGLPPIGGHLPIPAVHTDFPLAALGEELGMVGVLGVLACYLVIVIRGLRIAASAPDDFRVLFCTGLSLVIGSQAAIIAAGNLKLIPLTGITLPFISYGGSSLLANGLLIGLLLAFSDRGPEPPAAPRAARRLHLRRRRTAP
jgi:cell division protein FtsW (lipid II flippase)